MNFFQMVFLSVLTPALSSKERKQVREFNQLVIWLSLGLNGFLRFPRVRFW